MSSSYRGHMYKYCQHYLISLQYAWNSYSRNRYCYIQFNRRNNAQIMFLSGTKKLPLAQVFRDGNSRNRFVDELKHNEDKLFNNSFDSVQSSLGKKTNLKQTQICVRRSLKRPHDSFTTADKLEMKTELFLMPIPKKLNDPKVKLNATVHGELEKSSVNSPASSTEIKTNDLMDGVARNMRVFVGNVGFVVNTSKLHPKINALWDVYGKLIKISKGKHRFEHFLLIRNSDNSGPILQCAYFDFDNTLGGIAVGSNIRIVGKSNGLVLRTFRIEVYGRPVTKSNFIRIQNVNSFVLLQNQNTN